MGREAPQQGHAALGQRQRLRDEHFAVLLELLQEALNIELPDLQFLAQLPGIQLQVFGRPRQ
ncbi:hypothetical protein [Deinococcus multiflagellatus]|uniref:Uncharacterized protein n=1 Tax=Deinococcus multiflagellatus TaxID=1656887 RepID=A0ABW1ZK78_9DEIO